MADTLCFLPCCKKKTSIPAWDVPDRSLNQSVIPNTWRQLEAGRETMSYCVDKSIPQLPALQLYDGWFYRCAPDFRQRIRDAVLSDQVCLYVVSAGYGIVHALEAIHPYEAKMKGETAASWSDTGLVSVIEELINNLKPKRVFGFFAGSPHWSKGNASYRYFFTHGAMQAATSTPCIETAACFYRSQGQGVNAIMGALGRTLLCGIETGFSEPFVNSCRSGREDGNVTITVHTW